MRNKSRFTALYAVFLLAATFAFGQDSRPPQLTGISVTPQTVNVSTQSAEVTVHLALKDDVSGVAPVGQNNSYWAITLSSPSGRQRRLIFNRALKLDSGTPLNGTWSGTITMPRYSEGGPWTVSNVVIADGAGNKLALNSGALEQLGFRATLDVVSTPSDTTPPQLGGLTFDPPSLDTSTAAQQVTINLTATDDLSGVTFTLEDPVGPFQPVGIAFTSPSGKRSLTVMGKWKLAAGTPISGTWEASVTFPKSSEPGEWKVSRVYLTDTVRNSRTYGPELEALGVPSLIVIK